MLTGHTNTPRLQLKRCWLPAALRPPPPGNRSAAPAPGQQPAQACITACIRAHSPPPPIQPPQVAFEQGVAKGNFPAAPESNGPSWTILLNPANRRSQHQLHIRMAGLVTTFSVARDFKATKVFSVDVTRPTVIQVRPAAAHSDPGEACGACLAHCCQELRSAPER